MAIAIPNATKARFNMLYIIELASKRVRQGWPKERKIYRVVQGFVEFGLCQVFRKYTSKRGNDYNFIRPPVRLGAVLCGLLPDVFIPGPRII